MDQNDGLIHVFSIVHHDSSTRFLKRLAIEKTMMQKKINEPSEGLYRQEKMNNKKDNEPLEYLQIYCVLIQPRTRCLHLKFR